MLPSIGQFPVDLIGDHIQILFQDHLRDLLQILSFHHGPRGVVGEGEHKELGFLRYGIPQLLRGQAELVFLLQVDKDRNRVRQNGAGLVGNIAGLRDQHLVARVHHGPQGDVDGFRPSHRDQNLMGGIIFQIKTPLQVTADLRLQLF